MRRRILWLVVSGLMALSLIMAACGPAAPSSTPTTPTTPTTPSTPASPTTPATPTEKEAVTPTVEAPKYGGTLSLVQGTDFTRWDTHAMPTPGNALSLTNQLPWDGDWTLGRAGGYGAGKTDWAGYYYVFDLFTGYVTEKIDWSTDTVKDTGAIVYQIRRGIHYALDPNNEASRLANGRELTADDVILNFKRAGSTPGFFMYNVNPGLRTANITKTGPWEVTVRVGLGDLITALNWFNGKVQIMPPEVWQKYGGTTAEMGNWRNVVGTGPFTLTENIPGSAATMVRNPNYWMKDPVGPGKGNQLPYLNAVRVLIIPDAST
ncbi:MAG: ABC transporter substrate-binding protein, partial [Chloroflexota bacterium]